MAVDLKDLRVSKRWDKPPEVEPPAIIRAKNVKHGVAYFSFFDGEERKEISRKEANSLLKKAVIKYAVKYGEIPRNIKIEELKTGKAIILRFSNYSGDFLRFSFIRKKDLRALDLAIENRELRLKIGEINHKITLLQDSQYVSAATAYGQGGFRTGTDLDKIIELMSETLNQTREIRKSIHSLKERKEQLLKINKTVNDRIKEALLCVKKKLLIGLSSKSYGNKEELVSDILKKYDRISLIGLLFKLKDNPEAFRSASERTRFIELLFPRLAGEEGVKQDVFTAWSKKKVEKEIQKIQKQINDLEKIDEKLGVVFKQLKERAEMKKQETIDKLAELKRDLWNKMQDNWSEIKEIWGDV